MKTTTKVKELIKDEVSMGTYGLVELEVRALEQSNKDLLEALVEMKSFVEENRVILSGSKFTKCINSSHNAISKALI